MAPVDDLLALLDVLAEAAAAAGRSDLAERVRARRDLLATPTMHVVVAGEFKAGKSSLVNALVDADVCPVDDDVATSVPTLVRFAPEPVLHVRRDSGDNIDENGNGHANPEAVDRVAAYATEAGNPANREGVRLVEVGIPAPVLRGGLVLVDTPGVGGLGSTYASATTTALALAHAVLFVSDASQEYTAPELDFLAAARQACPEVVAVLTKVDVVPHWRAVHERNERWLDQAGLVGGLVATSAALHIYGRRQGRSDLRAESGMDDVVARLAEVAGNLRRAVAAGAVDEVHAVLGQLAAPVRAERDALADPAATIEALRQAEDQARGLTADVAEWLAVLDDGMIDLEDSVDADLASRMNAVLAQAEQTVRATDPASSWDELSGALTRQVSDEISAVAVRLTDGANEVAERLARHFAEHEAAIAPAMPSVGRMRLGGEGGLAMGTGTTPWRGVLVDAGWGGLEALGVLGSILTFTSISLFNPFSLVIGALIGGKTLRDSRRRELERRREQAVESVTKYVQDATRAADRELKSTTRRVRRELRTTYQRRAEALHRSASESLAAAERTLGTDESDRAPRREALAARLAELQSLDQRADAVAAALVG